MSKELNTFVVCTVVSPKNSNSVSNENAEKKINNETSASNRWFKCNVCKKVFDRKSSLVLHERTHLDDRPLTCKVCQKTFIDKSLLTKHVQTHDDEKSIVCEKNRSIGNSKDLLGVQKGEFANDKSFKCHVCIETFKEESALKNHLILHVSNNGKSFIQTSCEGKTTELNNGHKTETEDLLANCVHEDSLNVCEGKDNADLQLNSVEKTNESNICHETKTENLVTEHCSRKTPFNYKISNESLDMKLELNGDEKSVVCNICQKVLKSGNLLSEHPCCQKQFLNNEAAVSKKGRGGVKVVQLKTGRKPGHLYTRGQFNRKGKKSFMCYNCKEILETKSSFSLHFCAFKSTSRMKTYNRVSKSFKCDIPEKTVQDKSPFKVSQFMHMQQLVCDICKQHFINQDALTFHLQCHIEAKFVCEDCQTAFDTRKLLEIHRRSIGRKQFLCNICQKVFCCEKNLTNHYDLHNRKESFPCDVCDKVFANKFILYLHYYSHTKNVPFFICPVCLKIFSSRNNWVSHCCTHIGTKPFICKICKKYFIKRKNLYLHCRIHTDEEPYICEICLKAFKYYNTMIMHRHIHARENL